jgi:hypothetical protein
VYHHINLIDYLEPQIKIKIRKKMKGGKKDDKDKGRDYYAFDSSSLENAAKVSINFLYLISVFKYIGCLISRR